MVFVFLTSFRMMRLAHYINSISIKKKIKPKQTNNNKKKNSPLPYGQNCQELPVSGKMNPKVSKVQNS